MNRPLRTGLCVLGCLGLAAAQASAANLSSSGSQITYAAVAGETNNLTITRSGANFVFADSGAPVTPAAPCVAINANTASCPTTGISQVDADVGDLNDVATVDASVTIARVILRGGPGTDTLTGGENANDTLNGDADADTLVGRGQDDALNGGDGNDTMDGGSGRDTFASNAGNDAATGGPGDDNFLTGNVPDGADTVAGGPDFDSIRYSQRLAPVALSSNGVADDGEGGEGDNVGVDVEEVSGGQADDTITGSATTQFLSGGGGNDTLNGGTGRETLFGDDGNDTLIGADGNDTFFGGRGTDTLDGGPGDDTFESTFIDDDPDVMRGGAGNDVMGYLGANGPVTVTLDGVANDGVAGENDNVGADVEDVIGSFFNDTLTGNSSANQLDGRDGDDTINGLAGNDGLDGGRGNDTMDGGAGIDALVGGPGIDRIRSRDTSSDDVQCGSETDIALADPGDVLRACESASLGVAVLTQITRVVRGRVLFTLSCPAAEGVACVGTLRLSAKSALGSRSFNIPSGQARNVTVSVSAAGRRILNRRAATPVQVRAQFLDAAGALTTTQRTTTVRRR